MNFMSVFGQILAFLFTLGFAFWSLKYVISFYIFSRKREEINKLNARISILKLHLRSKLKKKINKIESTLRKDTDILSLAKPKLELLSEIKFDHAPDYQKFISNLYEITLLISEHVRSKHKNLLRTEALVESTSSSGPLTDEEAKQEKCRKLVKYDKAHMTIVIEIILATNELIQKTAEFNTLTEYEHGQKKISDIPEKIEIDDYEILHSLVEQAKTSDIGVPDFPILEKDLFEEAA